MSFQKWVQDDFVQGGVFAPLLNAIKLILKHPNKSPFKYARVEGTIREFSSSLVKSVFRKAMVEIDIKEAIVGSVEVSTEGMAHCEVTLVNPTNNT